MQMVNTKENTERLMLRLPPDAKLWIGKQARRNCSSANSEIVRCIREAQDREAQARSAERPKLGRLRTA